MRSGLDNLLARRPRLLALACTALMAGGGCASPLPAYRPFSHGGGYSDTLIAPSLYEVSYDSANGTASSEATWFAKVRAAELAVQRGMPYFRIVQIAHDSRIRTIITPPTTAFDTTRIYDDHEHQVTERQTYRTDPGSEERYFVPSAILLVEFLEQPSDRTLEAAAILQTAAARAVPLSPETTLGLSQLAASATSRPTTRP